MWKRMWEGFIEGVIFELNGKELVMGIFGDRVF